MSPVTVLDSPYMSLFYHPESKIVHHRFYKALDSQHLREGLNRGVELLQQHRGIKWLSDNREIDAHSPEDTDWINEHWLPDAIAAGWKYWALVVPDDVMARINMSEFIDSFYQQGVRVMVFVDPNDAMRWLEKADK